MSFGDKMAPSWLQRWLGFTITNVCPSIKDLLTRKKKCVISHLGGGVSTKLGHFHTFFIFFFHVGPKSCKSAKNFFLEWGGGYHPPESQIFFGHTM